MPEQRRFNREERERFNKFKAEQHAGVRSIHDGLVEVNLPLSESVELSQSVIDEAPVVEIKPVGRGVIIRDARSRTYNAVSNSAGKLNDEVIAAINTPAVMRFYYVPEPEGRSIRVDLFSVPENQTIVPKYILGSEKSVEGWRITWTNEANGLFLLHKKHAS